LVPLLITLVLAHEGDGRDDATLYAVACVTCGDTFSSEEPDDECAACLMPADELAALRAMRPAPIRPRCAMCGGILTASDETRCAVCARFLPNRDRQPRHDDTDGGPDHDRSPGAADPDH
jgi:rRNA maturation endonuclease Nob1